MRQLLFLGTGHGMPLASSCSSILVEDEHTNLLLDAGGGHDLLGQFHRADRNAAEVSNVFLSHYDSDHILGFVPLVRAFHRWGEPRQRTIFCSKEVHSAITSLFEHVAKKHYQEVREQLHFVILEDQATFTLGNWDLTFFDVQSNKSPQFGCVIQFPDHKKLSFLGDEPLRESYLPLVENSDVLIHEAFCLDGQRNRFKPHQKSHGTVKEAAQNARKASAQKLVLFHMEDETLKTRKETYTQEAKTQFSGEVFVPVDLDTYQF